MREIKFRAWDKSQNKMYQVRGINFDNEDLWLKINETQIMGANLFEVELMQYTGLKDKNGKEIYEGDIIQCMVNDNSIKGEEAYILGKEGFGLEHIKKVVNYKIEFWNSLYNYGYRVRNGKANFMITQGALNTMNAKKIGNIYENPELLKEGE